MQLHETERGTQEQYMRSQTLAKVTVDKEATIEKAEGEAKAMEVLADAEFYRAEQRAKGTQVQLEAEAAGFLQLLEAYGTNEGLAKFKLGNDARLWHKQAEEQANAMQNANPHFSVFQNNSDGNPLVKFMEQVLPVGEAVMDHLAAKAEAK